MFNQFFKDKVDLYNRILSFDSRWNMKILEKLQKESNKLNFLSIISELNFAFFFDRTVH